MIEGTLAAHHATSSNGKHNSENPLLVQVENVKKASRVIRAVNHPLRQKMISLVHDNKTMNVTDIYVKLRIEQSVASQHLAILRSAEAVKTRRDGKQIFYSVNYDRLAHINKYANELLK